MLKLNKEAEFKRLMDGWKERYGDKVTPEFTEDWLKRFELFDIRGDCKKPCKSIADGKTYLVPIVDIMLHGMKGTDLGTKYTEEIEDE